MLQMVHRTIHMTSHEIKLLKTPSNKLNQLTRFIFSIYANVLLPIPRLYLCILINNIKNNGKHLFRVTIVH